jgi:hypothetical protein
MQTRDDELAHAFNDSRRSRMIVQLAAIYAYGVLEPSELERFTQPTRATIELLAKEITGECAGPRNAANLGWARPAVNSDGRDDLQEP